MFRSGLLLVRQTRLGCRHYRRKQNVESHSKLRTGEDFKSGLGRSIAFTIGTTTLFYTGGTLMLYENTRAAFFSKIKQSPRKWYENYPVIQWWKKQTPSKKLFYGIVAANSLVFLMWQIPRLSSFMFKYFAHSPTSNMVLPMLLSVFSHKSALHLGCNMLVLYSFIDAAVAIMGKEQFLATYLSGGVVSALGSHLGKIYTRNPAVSLGASGAILTAIAYFCMAFPDAQMQIILLPMVTFKAITGIKGMVAFDTIGLLSRWSFLDHAAHLGGAFFGIGYFLGGNKLYFMYSAILVRYWDRVRSGARKDDK